MTREEAITMLKSKMDGHTDTSYEWVETVRMAIQALEQEPCVDTISREVACKFLTKARMINDSRPMEEIFAEIPSVTPEEKVGHWIMLPPFMEEICMCSNCKTKFKKAYQFRDSCPNCRARMERKE